MRTPGFHLLIIDPQNDFVSRSGALSVPGAEQDMNRLAHWLEVHTSRIEQVTVSLDCHHVLDISHPTWWKDEQGNHPQPFTVLTAQDVESGRWTASSADRTAQSLVYLRALEESNRYPHVIWPEHCLMGDPGCNVWPPLAEAIHRWERTRHRTTEFVLKGQNPWTEHFSALRAEVPVPNDPDTHVNTRLIESLARSDRVVVAGEARSHCVANTVRDLAEHWPGSVDRIVLLTDACSDVPGFESAGTRFVEELVARGLRTSTTVGFGG